MKTAIYPGSFDPVTAGHLDIIRRAAGLCDRLIVVVMHNQAKKPAFSPEERCALLRRAAEGLPNVEVQMLYIGRAHVLTPVTRKHLVFSLML